MNYSNMIEEKGLKKSFIVATLVSTVIGTFTASMTLADKVQEKRNNKKQKATDGKQDGQIQALRDQVDKLSREKEEAISQRGSRSRSQSTRRRRRRDDDEDDDEIEVATNARRSRAMIERMYEDNMLRMGQQYGYGDLVTENKLQAQVIQLQQTVINVLQDALYSGRDLSESDLRRLVTAQNAAREGSLDALEGRTKRMLAQKRPPQAALDYDRHSPDQLLIEDAFPPPRRQTTLPERVSSQRSHSPPPRSRTLPLDAGSLFCRYSEQLQYSSRALDPAFDPSGDGHCPSCSTTIPVIHEIIVPLTDADYRVSERYVVKSHTPDGRFACVLCHRHRDVDCVCRDVEALAKHLVNMHTSDEAHRETDLVEVQDMSVRQRQLEYSR